MQSQTLVRIQIWDSGEISEETRRGRYLKFLGEISSTESDTVSCVFQIKLRFTGFCKVYYREKDILSELLGGR